MYEFTLRPCKDDQIISTVNSCYYVPLILILIKECVSTLYTSEIVN